MNFKETTLHTSSGIKKSYCAFDGIPIFCLQDCYPELNIPDMLCKDDITSILNNYKIHHLLKYNYYPDYIFLSTSEYTALKKYTKKYYNIFKEY